MQTTTINSAVSKAANTASGEQSEWRKERGEGNGSGEGRYRNCTGERVGGRKVYREGWYRDGTIHSLIAENNVLPTVAGGP